MGSTPPFTTPDKAVRSVGRPSIGTPVEVTLSGDVLALVERVAASRGKTRSALLREIVENWAVRQP